MKARAVRTLRVLPAAVVTLALSWALVRPTAELCAALIRRHWPAVWFSGLIVWGADFFAFGFSIAMAVVVGRYIFKRKVS